MITFSLSITSAVLQLYLRNLKVSIILTQIAADGCSALRPIANKFNDILHRKELANSSKNEQL